VSTLRAKDDWLEVDRHHIKLALESSLGSCANLHGDAHKVASIFQATPQQAVPGGSCDLLALLETPSGSTGGAQTYLP